MVKANVKATTFNSVSPICAKCAGKFSNLSQPKRQAAVLAEYGMIGNNCVCDNKGHDRCPHTAR